MTDARHEHFYHKSGLEGYVRNEPVLRNLFAAIEDQVPIIELVGAYGSGKTTLLQTLVHDGLTAVDGVIEYYRADPNKRLIGEAERIAGSFRRSTGRNLLLIDEGERMEMTDLLGGLQRLGDGSLQFSTIVATVNPLNIGRVVGLMPLNLSDMTSLLEARLDQPLPQDVALKLWAASQGVPRLANILAHRWKTGVVRDFDGLADLFNPLAVPGLVDSRGRPLARGGHEERTIISDVRFVSEELLKAVGEEPELALALSPREFEELSAELFQRQGYDVTLTSQTRDGGKDLYLAKADGFGSFLYIVECKRNAPDRPVDVGVVRALYGVAQKERVTAAMTLTTSYFSKDATDFAADIRYQLKLKDFIDLKLLLAPHGPA